MTDPAAPADDDDGAGVVAPPGTFRIARAGLSVAQRRAGGVAALLLVLAGVLTLKTFLPALAWAAVFGIALEPWRRRLRQRWPDRPASVAALLVLGVLLLFVVPIILVTAPLVQDARAAALWVAQAHATGVPPPAVLADLPFGDRITAWWQKELGHPGGLSVMGGHMMQGGLSTTVHTVGEAARRLVLFAFMLLALFFLLRDGDAFAAELRNGAARAFGPAGESVGRQVIRSVRGTVNGLVLVGLGEGVLLGIVYALCGTPRPTLFGFVTALLATIPFGAPVAFLTAAAVTLAIGNVTAAIVIVVIGFVVLFFADHIVRPVLIGGATRLPFLWVLLGILGGVEAWGLVGLFVGPAVMAALVLLWREWIGAQAGPLNPAVGADAAEALQSSPARGGGAREARDGGV